MNIEAYLMINLDQRTETDARLFFDAIEGDENIIECSAVTGTSDVIAKVVVSDIEALGDLTMNRLLRLPSVRSIQSSVVVKRLKQDKIEPA